MSACGLILLAAGSSSRLQQAKQSLPYKGTTLLQHSLQAALFTPADPLVIVSGAYTNPGLFAHERVRVIHNQEWKEGIASSIRCGLSALLTAVPLTESIIIMVCDQPFVSTALLNQLINTSIEEKKDIVACSYRNTIGTPVLFTKKYFDTLLTLQGDEGAKKIVLQYIDHVAVVPFDKGEIDIDTMKDYHNLIQDHL